MRLQFESLEGELDPLASLNFKVPGLIHVFRIFSRVVWRLNLTALTFFCWCWDWLLPLLAGDDDVRLPDAAHPDPSLHLDVALVAPASPPGVLHQPVVHTVLSAVAHHHHRMVGGAPAAACEDSPLVMVKPRVGTNS